MSSTANATAKDCLSDLSDQDCVNIQKTIMSWKLNAAKNKYPAIFSVNNRSKPTQSKCHEFVGSRQGSTKKKNARPQKKFNILNKKVYLANIINFLSERNKLKKDDLKSFLKQEVSHLCGHKWCINQQHITRESHKLNCARRDNCKDKCRCEEQERMPRCV